jgi:hypothetical protein
MDYSVLGHVAQAIAHLVIDKKTTFVRALLLSYPNRSIPSLVLRINDELDEEMQERFATMVDDLAVGD